jgi:plastocyanin
MKTTAIRTVPGSSLPGALRGLLLLLLGVTALTAAGCSQHQEVMGPGNQGNGQVVEIEIRNFEFSQPELHIAPGTTVRWRNTTTNYHTVTPDGHAAWSQWQTASPGETFEVSFDQVGTYPYYCVPHRALGMMGTIIVE